MGVPPVGLKVPHDLVCCNTDVPTFARTTLRSLGRWHFPASLVVPKRRLCSCGTHFLHPSVDIRQHILRAFLSLQSESERVLFWPSGLSCYLWVLSLGAMPDPVTLSFGPIIHYLDRSFLSIKVSFQVYAARCVNPHTGSSSVMMGFCFSSRVTFPVKHFHAISVYNSCLHVGAIPSLPFPLCLTCMRVNLQHSLIS